jgi:hypothetical protein
MTYYLRRYTQGATGLENPGKFLKVLKLISFTSSSSCAKITDFD